MKFVEGVERRGWQGGLLKGVHPTWGLVGGSVQEEEFVEEGK
jgi:hypothetical protein